MRGRFFLLPMLLAISAAAYAQPQLDLAGEIRLPVRPSRGSLGSESIKQYFSIQKAPDESVLAFVADGNGQWPLVRLKKWWSRDPAVDVLQIPGWTSTDATWTGEVFVDLQVSPGGRYAVAFAGAYWEGKDSLFFPLSIFAPKVARRPDTIITVIDLEKWLIVKSVHTAQFEDVGFRGGRIVSDDWIALQGLEPSRPTFGNSIYLRRNRLMSLPALEPGVECISERVDSDIEASQNPHSRKAGEIRQRNDETCRDVLNVAGPDSLEGLESLIYTGHPEPPKPLKLLDLPKTGPVRSKYGDQEGLGQVEAHIRLHYDHWSQVHDLIHGVNPPFESTARRWYGLYGRYGSPQPVYEVRRFDAEGRQELSRETRALACGNPAVGNAYCGCRVEDVAEAQHTLLAYCRTGEYGGGAGDRQWLAVFRADDLSEQGMVSLSKGRRVRDLVAVGDARTYVVTVESGELLRVYSLAR